MNKTFHVLLADDDADDRFFFEKVVEKSPIPARLTTVEDGAALMVYLSDNVGHLPDLLFLDLNMPKKNGQECLQEIKQNEKLKHLPVIIYSTSMDMHVADFLYHKGAHYYVGKTDFAELRKMLQYVLTLLGESDFAKPPREKFVLSQFEYVPLIKR